MSLSIVGNSTGIKKTQREREWIGNSSNGINSTDCTANMPSNAYIFCRRRTQIEYLLETIYIIVGCWVSVSNWLVHKRVKIHIYKWTDMNSKLYAQLLHACWRRWYKTKLPRSIHSRWYCASYLQILPLSLSLSFVLALFYKQF